MNKHNVVLVDDGTLDTVINVNGIEYRFAWDGVDGTYDDFIAWAKEEAIDAYETDLELDNN